MAEQKKITFSRALLFLIIICILVIVGLAVKDMLVTPAERLQNAVVALNDKEYKKAERFFIVVAEQGDKEQQLTASYYLAQLYYKGAEGFVANAQKAALFYEKAAMAGLPEAQYQLALMYDTGDKIPENRTKALLWMNEAAKQGMPEALYSLGVWVERGYMGGGIPMDKVVALYEAAAVQDHKNAMTSLVSIYAMGEGSVAPDAEKMVYWKNRLEELNKKK
ncbi:MAG: sel1 repeat family protein [Alphaproteobacteria bacterium]|nr:sel1 repeat family protein [Alphaproteobacteria bacterium]